MVKYVFALSGKAQMRKKEKKFVVEGRREVRLALEGGYELEQILFLPDLYDYEQLENLVKKHGFNGQIIEINREVYEKLAYRGSTEGIIAVAKARELTLSNLKLSGNPLILVAEAIEKPGNIGAMLRTVDASGIDAFVLADSITDIYNPNIIRSSVGGIFTSQIALASTTELIEYLEKNGIKLYAATLQDSVVYYNEDYTAASAIAVGNEANGLSTEMREAAYKKIRIPMRGKLDSLNVSVSAAILVSEACRQRSVSGSDD